MNLSISRVGFAMPMQAQNVQFRGKEIVLATNAIKEVLKNPEVRTKTALALATVATGTILAMQNGKAPTTILDKTNLEACLKARPEQLYRPVKADNIKGQGISFLTVLPETAEGLRDVTYDVVPLPKAATVEEMIAKAKEQGVNIELVQDENGMYYLGVKDVWSNGYHRINRDGAVIKYGLQPLDWTSVDSDWAKENSILHPNKKGEIVPHVMDCAVIANAPGVRILEKSYVHEGGALITTADMAKSQFRAHKDPNALINAVAWDAPRTIQTLEGPITVDVTMGDVEGYAYNNFAQLVKQIQKNKIKANPADSASVKFCELIMEAKGLEGEAQAQKLAEAKALLVDVTKA